jgi:Protein of unknown function (DUF2934)
MAKTIQSASSITQKSPTPSISPTQEEIALRAYYIYLQRGGAPGNEFADWTRAEQELLAEAAKPRRKAVVKSIAA